MRFPSLIRLPKHKQFEIKPRYYDPIKEEIEERTSRIRREMGGELDRDPGQRITFERKTSNVPSASVMQLAIAAILGLSFVGWLQYGNDIAYAFIVVIPIYFFFRFRKIFKR